MKKIFSNNLMLMLLALIFALVGIIQSFLFKDFIWFARSGSLIVAIGIILLSRTFIIGKDLLLDIQSADTQFNVNSPEHYAALNETIPDYVANDLKSRKAIGLIGPMISTIGTIVWGYADLLNFLFNWDK